MTLAYIYPETLPSNFARSVSVINTCNHLFELDESFELVTLTDFDNTKISKKFGFSFPEKNITLLAKNMGPLRSNKVFNFRLKRWLRNTSSTYLYTRHIKTAAFLLKHRKLGQKVIFESHQLFYTTTKDGKNSSTSRKLRAMETFIYNNVDGLTFINETLKALIYTEFDIQNTPYIILYNGITPEPEIIHKSFTTIQDFYYVGNLMTWKGVDQLIDVMSNYPSIRLHIIGGESQQRIDQHKQLAQQLGVGHQVIFYGHQSAIEIREVLINKAVLTFIPNAKSEWNRYSMPLKLLEYMNFGNIVISADMPTIQELCTDEQQVFFYQTGEKAALKAAIDKVLKATPNQLQTMSIEAQQLARTLSWQNRAQLLNHFVHSLA